MTLFILEDLDARGNYFAKRVAIRTDLGTPGPAVELTNVKQHAQTFDAMTPALLYAAELPGRWQAIPV